MEGSGDVAEEMVLHNQETASNFTADEPLLTGDSVTNDIVSKVANIIITTGAPAAAPVAYSPAHLRIGLLSVKCLLALLVFVLSCAIRRRDFLKSFIFVLLVPILLECGFDIYTEVRASMDGSGRIDQRYDYYMGEIPQWTGPLHAIQTQAIDTYGDVLTYYTTYKMFASTWWIAVVEYSLSAWLFWSSIFSSIGAFQYAHKAIARPDEISYTHFFRGFVYIQLLVVLPLSTLDVLLSVFTLPPLILAIVSVIPRFAACIGALFLFIQALVSLFIFCKRHDEYVKTSPYSQVRNSKARLFWFILFQVILQALAAPYLIWAAISLEEDFSKLFNVSLEILRPLALESFALHFSCFLLRPLVLLLFSIVLLPPYRKKFLRSCCGCCNRN